MTHVAAAKEHVCPKYFQNQPGLKENPFPVLIANNSPNCQSLRVLHKLHNLEDMPACEDNGL